MRLAPPQHEAEHALQAELLGSRNAVEEILRRAAQVLGVLTQELGVAVAPALDEMVLERLELVPVSVRAAAAGVQSAERRGADDLRRGAGRGRGRTRCSEVARVLNERLAGLTLQRDPHHAVRAAPRCGWRRRRARAAEYLHRRGRGDLRPARTSRTRWCSGSARCWRSSRSSPPAPDARAARADRGTRPAARGARARAGRPGSRSRSAPRTPTPGSADFTVVTASYQAGDAHGRHRRHGSDADAVRQDHLAGGAHQPPGEGLLE